MQHVAVTCGMLQCVAVFGSVLQCAVVCRSALHSVQVCCSVLQCVAVRYSVLQCVAMSTLAVRSVAVGQTLASSNTSTEGGFGFSVGLGLWFMSRLNQSWESPKHSSSAIFSHPLQWEWKTAPWEFHKHYYTISFWAIKKQSSFIRVMEHTRFLLSTRNSSTRKLFSCGLKDVVLQMHYKEALLRDAQSEKVGLGALVAPACLFHPWARGCKARDAQSVLSQMHCKEALLWHAQRDSVSLGALVAAALVFFETTHSKTRYHALFSDVHPFHCSACHFTAPIVFTTKNRLPGGCRPCMS